MKLNRLFLALVSIAMLSSCEMMKEDEDLTNCGLFVTFKYDYNLQRADMFGDHVGGVTLYVFDSDGRYVRSYESNDIPSMGMMLDGEYVHAMQILDLPNGKYRFIALANQKSYEATLATPGPKYRRTELSTGDNCEKLKVTTKVIAISSCSNLRGIILLYIYIPIIILFEFHVLDTLSPREDVDTHLGILPYVVLDKEIQVVVVRAVKVFLTGVGIEVIGITSLCQEVCQVYRRNLVTRLLVTDNQQGVLVCLLIPYQAVEGQSGMCGHLRYLPFLITHVRVPLMEGSVHQVLVFQKIIIIAEDTIIIDDEVVEVVGVHVCLLVLVEVMQ